MARPQKKGLSYFPFDVDFFNDRKIKILFSKFGSMGIMIYIYIICEIYKEKGYYLLLDEETVDFFCSELKITKNEFADFIEFFLKKNLFDKKLWENYRVIASRPIQERYQKAKEAAGRKTPIPVNKKFWLVHKEDTMKFINFVENDTVKDKSFTDDNSPCCKASEEFLENSGGKNAQSKVNKNKINKIKGDTKIDLLLVSVENYFSNNPPNIKNNIIDFIDKGVPLELIRYGFSEAVRKNKPFSYMAAVIKQKFKENKVDFKEKKTNKTYDIEDFKNIGLKIPKV